MVLMSLASRAMARQRANLGRGLGLMALGFERTGCSRGFSAVPPGLGRAPCRSPKWKPGAMVGCPFGTGRGARAGGASEPLVPPGGAGVAEIGLTGETPALRGGALAGRKAASAAKPAGKRKRRPP